MTKNGLAGPGSPPDPRHPQVGAPALIATCYRWWRCSAGRGRRADVHGAKMLKQVSRDDRDRRGAFRDRGR